MKEMADPYFTGYRSSNSGASSACFTGRKNLATVTVQYTTFKIHPKLSVVR
jgi:hypothetical protein